MVLYIMIEKMYATEEEHYSLEIILLNNHISSLPDLTFSGPLLLFDNDDGNDDDDDNWSIFS